MEDIFTEIENQQYLKKRSRKLVVLSVAHAMYRNGVTIDRSGSRNENLNINEYEYSLGTSMKIINLLNLKNSCKAVLLDYSYIDSYHEMMKRKIIDINSLNPKLAIEIHFNAFNEQVKGHEVLYYSKYGKYYANIINNNLSNMKEFGIDRGITQRKDLFFLKTTKCPAVIVEPLFLDNNSEARYLLDSSFLDSLSFNIFTGIKEIMEQKKPEELRLINSPGED